MDLLEKLKGKLRRRPAPAAAGPRRKKLPRSGEARAQVHAIRRMDAPAWAEASAPHAWFAVEMTVTSSSAEIRPLDLLLVGAATVGASDARVWDDDAWQGAEDRDLMGEWRVRVLFALPEGAAGVWHVAAASRSLGVLDLGQAR